MACHSSVPSVQSAVPCVGSIFGVGAGAAGVAARNYQIPAYSFASFRALGGEFLNPIPEEGSHGFHGQPRISRNHSVQPQMNTNGHEWSVSWPHTIDPGSVNASLLVKHAFPPQKSVWIGVYLWFPLHGAAEVRGKRRHGPLRATDPTRIAGLVVRFSGRGRLPPGVHLR
jgi:hypothetical protein